MKLLVGLGNPGPKYETTRHNAGFLMLDEIADQFKIAWSGEKFHGVIGKGVIYGEDTVLLKPMTFMNVSGKAVRAAMDFFKIAPNQIIVLHDDVDLEAGAVKARFGGGHGGNNGVRSIIEDAGFADFHRIKVGVGRPDGLKGVKDWVLSQFTDEELLGLQQGVLKEVLVRLENIYKQK